MSPTEPRTDPRHHYVPADGESAPLLHYTESGPRDAPLTVLLLHSLGTDHRLWEPQRGPLAGAHRVLVADARGHGQSAWHGPLDTDTWCHDIERVLNHAGADRAVLVGLSMGGVQALAFAQARPERVAGLVAADTFAELDPSAAQTKVAGLVGEAEQDGMAALADSYVASTFTTQPFPPGADDVRAAIAATSFAAYAASARACFTARLAAGLATITAPTTILWGERDAKTPRSLSEELRQGVAGARIEVVPAAGHLANLENPDVFSEAVQAFLAELENGTRNANDQANRR